jgi:hypothetical protein
MQKLSIDIETKILNDMDERLHDLTRIGVERPEFLRIFVATSLDFPLSIFTTISPILPPDAFRLIGYPLINRNFSSFTLQYFGYQYPCGIYAYYAMSQKLK